MLAYPPKCIQMRVHIALKRLKLHDLWLFRSNSDERTITHRLAMYLQDEFPTWNVDCEYNRNQYEVKKLSKDAVRPDIIIHHRRTHRNLLVIEAKKTNNRADDQEKLEKYYNGLRNLDKKARVNKIE